MCAMLAIMDYVVMSNIYIGAQHKKIAKIALDAISIISVKIMLFIGDVVELLLVDNIRVFIYNIFNTSFCKISNRHARISSAWLECLLWEQEVESSNPSSETMSTRTYNVYQRQ